MSAPAIPGPGVLPTPLAGDACPCGRPDPDAPALARPGKAAKSAKNGKGKKSAAAAAAAPALSYGQCCGRFLGPAATGNEADGIHADGSDAAGAQAISPLTALAAAPDAESLMRSRYCAFALQRHDYLLATWHASTRPDPLELDGATRWLGLTVQDHSLTGPDSATVRFVARWRQVGSRGGQAGRLSETSRFLREDGRWYYVDGDMDFGSAVGQPALAPAPGLAPESSPAPDASPPA